MQEIIQQVGSFLLGAVPTMILFVVLVIAYQILVQGPLSRTLKERRARTAGAVEEAQKAIAAAEAKATDYAARLRHARAEIFKVRESRLKQWAQERDAQLDVARKSAGARVTDAKAALQAEGGAARKTLMASSSELVEQVVRAVMPAAAGGTR